MDSQGIDWISTARGTDSSPLSISWRAVPLAVPYTHLQTAINLKIDTLISQA